MLLTIVTFIIILSLLVFVHEFGHFWVARKFGVKAEEFGFGFPPRVWGFYKSTDGNWKRIRGNKQVEDAADTIYSVNLVPLGGFVKIKGENGEEAEDKDSFGSKKIWQRACILLAGVTMNIILAAALLSLGFAIGLPQVLDENISSAAKVSDKQIQIVEIAPDSPAFKAGIKEGDILISINDEKFESYKDLQKYVDEHTGRVLTYRIKQNDEILEKGIVPEIRKETNKGGIGIAVMETGIVSYPWYLAPWYGIKSALWLTWAILVAFYELFKGLFMGHGVSAEISGPVGIAALTGRMARMGFVYLIQFASMLSINLAIINALPFPALDGGRVLFLIIEKIKGSPVKKEVEAIIHNLGFALLMLLVLVVTFKDVLRYGDSFKNLWEKIIG